MWVIWFLLNASPLHRGFLPRLFNYPTTAHQRFAAWAICTYGIMPYLTKAHSIRVLITTIFTHLTIFHCKYGFYTSLSNLFAKGVVSDTLTRFRPTLVPLFHSYSCVNPISEHCSTSMFNHPYFFCNGFCRTKYSVCMNLWCLWLADKNPGKERGRIQ